jgi:hypothetical protein
LTAESTLDSAEEAAAAARQQARALDQLSTDAALAAAALKVGHFKCKSVGKYRSMKS